MCEKMNFFFQEATPSSSSGESTWSFEARCSEVGVDAHLVQAVVVTEQPVHFANDVHAEGFCGTSRANAQPCSAPRRKWTQHGGVLLFEVPSSLNSEVPRARQPLSKKKLPPLLGILEAAPPGLATLGAQNDPFRLLQSVQDLQHKPLQTRPSRAIHTGCSVEFEKELKLA